MRVCFTSSSIPTRAVKRLKKLQGIKEGPAREVTAHVLGYRDWHELETQCGKASPSQLDEELAPEEWEERSEYQLRRVSERLDALIPDPEQATTRIGSFLPIAALSAEQRARFDELVNDGAPAEESEPLSGFDPLLSYREGHFLRALTRYRSMSEIEQELQISPETAAMNMQVLRIKFAAASWEEIVVKAALSGLVELRDDVHAMMAITLFPHALMGEWRPSAARPQEDVFAASDSALRACQQEFLHTPLPAPDFADRFVAGVATVRGLSFLKWAESIPALFLDDDCSPEHKEAGGKMVAAVALRKQARLAWPGDPRERDYFAAELAEHERDAAKGQPRAACAAGALYQQQAAYSQGGEQAASLTKAAALYRQAAQSDDARGMLDLAYLLFTNPVAGGEQLATDGDEWRRLIVRAHHRRSIDPFGL